MLVLLTILIDQYQVKDKFKKEWAGNDKQMAEHDNMGENTNGKAHLFSSIIEEGVVKLGVFWVQQGPNG